MWLVVTSFRLSATPKSEALTCSKWTPKDKQLRVTNYVCALETSLTSRLAICQSPPIPHEVRSHG